MFKKVLPFVILSFCCFASNVSFAKECNKILVIDIEKVASESKVGKYIQTKLREQQEKIQKAIDTEKKKLTTEAEELQKKKSKLSEQDLNSRAAELQNKAMILETKFQGEIDSLQTKQATASQKIIDKIKDISNGIAKSEKGVCAIVAANTLLYFSPESDKTADVVAALDKEIQSIEI
jgi:Skp family chaperone for outer membrane proteins